MSKNAKYYNYYKVEGQSVKDLYASYQPIETRRSEVIDALVSKFGAVARTPAQGFGNTADGVECLVWSKDHEFPCPVTIKRQEYFEGKPVVIARGKENTKEGREFNKALDREIALTNRKLADLPTWKTFIIDHYGIRRTGLGEAGAKGIALLVTYGGFCPGRDDCLLFAVPNTKERDGAEQNVVIPAEFQQLTYGQFYDLSN